MTRSPWILAFVLFGCDLEERVEGIERVTVTLEEGVLGATAELESVGAELEAAKGRAKEAEEDRAALEERVEALEGALQRLEAKLDAPPPVPTPTKPPLAGRPDPAERYRVPVDGSATRGPDDAKVTLVVIADFQCPFCKRVQPTIRGLERRYGDDLRVVAKHNPLPMHPRAEAAAIAAEAAHEQGKFWELHDLLYDHSRALSDADIRKWAKKAGCDMSRFRSDLSKSSIGRRVERDAELAKRVGARGTPAFFINGRFLSGAQPSSRFEALIDEELKEADRRIAAGTAQDLLYETFMRSAKTGV